MGPGDIERHREAKQRSAPKAAKGGIQIGIGILAGILVLLNPAVGLQRLRVEHSIAHNEALLTELGYDPADFQRSPYYWTVKLAFHIFGFAAILFYVTCVALKRLMAVEVAFLLCLIYFLAHAYGNIAHLSYEAQVRGVTAGYWAGKVISWLPKYVVELGLLIQGLLGVRKRVQGHLLNTGCGFVQEQRDATSTS